MRDTTERRLEEALQWAPGSVRAVLEGRPPAPATTPRPGPDEVRSISTPLGEAVEEIFDDLEADTEGWSEEDRLEAERHLAERLRLQYAEFIRQREALRDLERKRKRRTSGE